MQNCETQTEKNLSKEELEKLESHNMNDDVLAANYGDIKLNDLQSNGISRKLTQLKDLSVELKGEYLLIHGSAHAIRSKGKNMAIIVVREGFCTVQCVLTVARDLVSPQMVKFATSLSPESLIDVMSKGLYLLPSQSITRANLQVEIQVRKLYCLGRPSSPLPFTIEDAARSDAEIDKALQAGQQLPRVSEETRSKHRHLDLRTPANQAIFWIKHHITDRFRQLLWKEEFFEIEIPEMEFGLRNFWISPVTVHMAGNNFTHRHLCRFPGLDVEMDIKEHYSEVMDIVDRLCVAVFDYLSEKCSKELEAIRSQYHFESLKYLPKTLRLTYEEAVQMLKEAGVEIDPFGDLNTESERKLGQLVLDKYDTEFYILHRYPLAVRPFFTMPSSGDPNYSNSFDGFIRGEKTISGAQHIHVHSYLAERAEKCGIDRKTLFAYSDTFRFGTFPHGGFRVRLDCVAMIFCALSNTRMSFDLGFGL